MYTQKSARKRPYFVISFVMIVLFMYSPFVSNWVAYIPYYLFQCRGHIGNYDTRLRGMTYLSEETSKSLKLPANMEMAGCKYLHGISEKIVTYLRYPAGPWVTIPVGVGLILILLRKRA